MKYLFYGAGVFFLLAGFVDGPNYIPLLFAFGLLAIGYFLGNIKQSAKDISSKKASEKLLTLAELKEKGIITQDEYDLKSRELKDKL